MTMIYDKQEGYRQYPSFITWCYVPDMETNARDVYTGDIITPEESYHSDFENFYRGNEWPMRDERKRFSRSLTLEQLME